MYVYQAQSVCNVHVVMEALIGYYKHLISLAGFVLDVPVVLPGKLVLIPGQQEKRCISTDQKTDISVSKYNDNNV